MEADKHGHDEAKSSMTRPCPWHTVLKSISEELLGRALTVEDGLDSASIEHAESALGFPIPQALKDYYRLVGKLPIFMDSFQQFLQPEEIYKTSGLLIFLEENQGVCHWGIDEENRIFQCQDDDENYAIELKLEQFLELMLYYQTAQGSECGYSVGLSDEELETTLKAEGWRLTVKHDSLVIYCLKGFLIWYFQDIDETPVDDFIYFSSNFEATDTLKEQYLLEEL